MTEQRLFEYSDHWLVKRPDTPNYYIYWCRPGTRRVRQRTSRTSDFEEAKRRLVEFAHRGGKGQSRAPETVSVVEALDDYARLTLKGRRSQGHAKHTMSLWAKFLRKEALEVVSDLTMDVQERYIHWRRESLLKAGHTASNATIQRDLATLKAALRMHWKRGRLESVPHIISVTAPPPRQRFLTREEFARLLDECQEPHLRLFVLLAIHTMQRPGSILELTTQQVDLDRGIIDFMPPWQQAQSNKRKPVVPISEGLRGPLTQAVENSINGYVVEYDGLPLKSVRTSFNKARDRAGLSKDVCPYVLRHTAATWLAASNVPLRQVAGMLGHSDTRTTERHYAKHSPEYLRQATGAMDMLLERSPSPTVIDSRESDSSKLLIDYLAA